MKAFGVFEGGGAKGYAHVGALQALETRGIELEAVAGSSIGAVIALLIAAGFTGDELFRGEAGSNSGLMSTSWVNQLNQTDWAAFEEFRDKYLVAKPAQPKNPPKKLGYRSIFAAGCSAVSAFYRHSHLFNQIWTHFGLTDAASFRNWLDGAVRQKIGIGSAPVLFRHLKIPLKVVAGDLLSGKMRVFGVSGDADLNAVDAVVASASYPLFFPALSFSGQPVCRRRAPFKSACLGVRRRTPSETQADSDFRFSLRGSATCGSTQRTSQLPTSLPEFLKRLVTSSVSGGQTLGARAIDEYYAFDLAADIDTLAFHEIEEKARDLVDAGRKGLTEFFDSQIGPTDPDKMETILGVIANFLVQALDRSARQKLSGMRAFVLIETSNEFIRVAYSANAAEDADDGLKIRKNSPGMAECMTLKEPVITFVPAIPQIIRTSPVFKYEHAVRPRDVITAYAVPIFRDPAEWSKDKPEERTKPIAALLIDSPEDLRYLLQQPEFEDRIATYAQICGEYLRGAPVLLSYGSGGDGERDPSELIALRELGFFISSRKPRSLFQDGETLDLVERVEMRIR
jgi:NTE family protein